MHPQFELFIQEKKYLCNVSPATQRWYRMSLRWLPGPDPDEQTLKNVVVAMRTHGLQASSVNCHGRAINSYLTWAKIPHRFPRLKEEQKILPTFSQADIKAIQRWKAAGFYEWRLQALLLTLADTGARINEALELRWQDVDFDNMLLKLHGKGAKERLVPYSFELRRVLWRWKQHSEGCDIVFATRTRQRLGQRNTHRDVRNLCVKLGIKIPERMLHAFRHTFGTNYVRRGGSVFHLQKVLGHSTLEMSRRYAHLCTEDLQKIHAQISLLQ